MSLNIHCSNRPFRPKVSHLSPLLLLIILLTADRSTINAQRAISDAELVHHSHYPNVASQAGAGSHVDAAHADGSNDDHNDLSLYDEPLWFEESEFNEHSADDHHQGSPFRNAIHSAQLDASLGLTIIPSVQPAAGAIRAEPQTFYLPAILPIHKRKLSENQTEVCSNEINSPAIYDLEAILWTLDQINQYVAYKNGLNINLAVLDSCSSPAILERRLRNLFDSNGNRSAIDLPDSLPSLSVRNIVGFVSSIPSAEFSVAHRLLSALNITIISAQDVSFLPSELGFERHALQTALPIEYFASAALQYLRQQNRNTFSVIYSNDSLQSSTMLDALVKAITLENSKGNQLLKGEKKRSKPASFCMQSVLNVPSHLNTGEASQFLIQLQNELKTNANNANSSDENLVLVLTESLTTRELLIAYQHLINAGILARLPFVLIKESNLNIVTGIESSMLNTLVIRESQKSLRDFVEYFEQLKADNNLRNPFFERYWQQSANCGQNRDCLFEQIEPINTINTIQSTYALTNSIISIRNQFCASRAARKLASSSAVSQSAKIEQAAFCGVFNSSLHSQTGGEAKLEIEKSSSSGLANLKAILLGHLLTSELDLHQLSKHFNHEMKFTEHGYPEKSVDVLKFRIVNQAYRFDRIANYLNSGLTKENFRDSAATPLTSLVLKHQLLACASNAPRHSSLTRTDLMSGSLSPYTSSSYRNGKMNSGNWSQSWWRCWYSVATIASLIGALISVVCAIYFLFTFDYKVGSTILGYMILLGIFLLYIVNFFFIFPYSFVNCWIRCYLMSVAYTVILASMLVKVMNSWRLHTYHNYNNLYIQHLNLVNGSANLNGNFNGFNGFNNANLNQNTNLFLSKKLNSISTLMSMCLGLVSLESLTNLVWLTIYPPRPQQILIDGVQQWKCYNIQFAVLIETDSIFSVLFAVLLILITMFFSCLTWKHSAINSYESRWIAFSCYVMLITWSVYGFLFKMFHLIELRDLFIVIANLLVSTSILICMFIRKLIIFYRLNKAKKYNNKAHHLVSSPSISSAASYNGSLSSYYGAVGANQSVGRADSKKISNQLKRTAKQSAKQMAKANRVKGGQRKTSLNSAQHNQEHLDNVDNVSTISAVTTTSSIISSVKSYFSKHNKPEEQEHQHEPDFHLSSITTAADPSQLGSASQQTEFYPMDVYEAYDAGRAPNQPSLQTSSQQPDSLFYTTKKSIFNSNHSLYAVDYT